MLITCSECGGTVSNRATGCPHCGNPIAAAGITGAPHHHAPAFPATIERQEHESGVAATGRAKRLASVGISAGAAIILTSVAGLGSLVAGTHVLWTKTVNLESALQAVIFFVIGVGAPVVAALLGATIMLVSIRRIRESKGAEQRSRPGPRIGWVGHGLVILSFAASTWLACHFFYGFGESYVPTQTTPDAIWCFTRAEEGDALCTFGRSLCDRAQQRIGTTDRCEQRHDAFTFDVDHDVVILGEHERFRAHAQSAYATYADCVADRETARAEADTRNPGECYRVVSSHR